MQNKMHATSSKIILMKVHNPHEVKCYDYGMGHVQHVILNIIHYSS